MDHNNLKQLEKSDVPKLVRQHCYLRSFMIWVRHIPGKSNTADYWSRLTQYVGDQSQPMSSLDSDISGQQLAAFDCCEDEPRGTPEPREVQASVGVTLRLKELVELELRAIRTICARKNLRRARFDIRLKSAFSWVHHTGQKSTKTKMTAMPRSID